MVLEPKRLTMRSKAYVYLKDLILSDQLQSGQRINQEFIANQLKISRTPIREALHRLRSEGLIETSETDGFRVCQTSLEELEELFDIRSELEGYLMRSICINITEEGIEKLAEIVENSEKAFYEKDSDEILKWNTIFHEHLQQYAGGKQRTHNIIVNMKEQMLRYRQNTLTRCLEAAERSIAAHKKILLAIQLRDPHLCEYLTQQHIKESKEDAIRFTFGNQEDRV